MEIYRYEKPKYRELSRKGLIAYFQVADHLKYRFKCTEYI